MQLTEHFSLAELLPRWYQVEPEAEILTNLQRLAKLLERVRGVVRTRYPVAVISVHSGYRPPARNQAVGGEAGSDHLRGLAADFHVDPKTVDKWQEVTLKSFDLIRERLKGSYGQLILEDRRKTERRPGALLLHISVPTPKHPGVDDPAMVLVSNRLHVYRPYETLA